MNKTFSTMIGIGAFTALAICPLCKTTANASPSARVATNGAALAAPRTVTLHITGMTCGGCVFGTKKVLTKLHGVTAANVSYEKAEAVVTYDDEKVTVEQMIAAVATLGYKAAVVGAPSATAPVR